MDGRDDQVALVLPVVVIGDHYDFAGFKGANDLDDALLVIRMTFGSRGFGINQLRTFST